MGVELTALHWIYVSFICIIIALMIWRKDTSLACMVGIFLLAITATGSLRSLLAPFLKVLFTRSQNFFRLFLSYRLLYP